MANRRNLTKRAPLGYFIGVALVCVTCVLLATITHSALATTIAFVTGALLMLLMRQSGLIHASRELRKEARADPSHVDHK